jgi:hypothetical protein
MTFAEIVTFVVAAFILYLVLRRFQPRLERIFYRFFRARSGKKGQVIDVTDYSKKDPQ